jgi:hypothetical protein
METPTDKQNLHNTIEAYAIARASGNAILTKASGMLVEEHLKRLPDKFPALEEPTNPAEPVNAEPANSLP